jgi:catechol 2,3-dioxygenase-like lactoylglutathione lyase family enzyme
MLSDFAVHPSLATANIDNAREWYAERLGLRPFLASPSLLAYQVGPTIFTVFETPAAGTAQNTVAIWSVPDLQAEVSRLRSRGLVFADLDLGGDERTSDGIMAGADAEGADVLNAWFRDGDGNWISMVEQPDHPDEPPAEMGVGAMLAAADLARARAWYADKLGLEPLHYLPNKEMVGDHEIGDARTVDGIYTDPDDGSLAAWFTDSEGNTLGLVEDHGEPIQPR